MSTYAVWEKDTGGEFIRPLFVGSESECELVAEDLYGIVCSQADPTWWKSVATEIVKNEGALYRSGREFGLAGDLVWFNEGDGYIWGEALSIEDGIVTMGECFHIGTGVSNPEEFGDGSWGMDLPKVWGVV